MTGSPSDQPAPERSAQYATTSPPLETHRPRIAPRVSSIFASGSSATRAKRPLGLQRHGALLPRHRIHTLLADTSRRPPPRGRARSHDAAHAASSARSVAMTEPAGQVPASNPGRAAKPESRNPVVVWSLAQFGRPALREIPIVVRGRAVPAGYKSVRWGAWDGRENDLRRRRAATQV